MLAGTTAASSGLSPRVRGNQQPDDGGGGYAGSIPACAGEPRTDDSTAGTAEVYPRVCGGTLTLTALLNNGWGLSPRVRGNRILTVQ